MAEAQLFFLEVSHRQKSVWIMSLGWGFSVRQTQEAAQIRRGAS